MAIFEGDYPQVQTATVTSSTASKVFASSGSAVSHNGLSYTWNYTTGQLKPAWTFLNTGPSTVYIGGGTGVTATNSGGVAVGVGQQVTFQGAVADVYAATAGSGATANIVVGLASNAAVV